MADKNIIDFQETDEEQDQDNVVEFSKPYLFEGEEITKLDLSGLEEITVEDMIHASDMLARSGRVVSVPETDIQYTLYIAHAATKKPYEFFLKLRPKDAARIRSRVTRFFFRGE